MANWFQRAAAIAAVIGLLGGIGSEFAEARTKKQPVKKKPVAARVVKKPVLRDQLPNKVTRDSAIIYFPTNSWTLDQMDYQAIADFVHAHPRASHWTVEGYCDERGTDAWNKRLGDNRAKGVAKFVRTYEGRGPIDAVSFGESNPANLGHSREAYRANRRVTIRVSQSTVSDALDRLPGDVYVLDASSSMTGDKWTAVRSYRFPTNAKLYAFSTCIDGHVRTIRSPSEVSPCGGTPLWIALDHVVKNEPGNIRATVLTDGENTEGGPNPQDITSRARSTNTKISIGEIAVVSQDARRTLEGIASSTGGNSYIVMSESP